MNRFVILATSVFLFLSKTFSEEQKLQDKKEYINGIDLRKLNDLIKKLKDDPTFGFMTFSSTTIGKGGTKSMTIFTGYEIEGKVKEAKKVQLQGDDFPELGGGDIVPVDIEEMMGAVGASVIAVASLRAALQGIELSRIEVFLEGDLDLVGSMEIDVHKRPGMSDFRVEILIAGNADEATLKKIAMDGWQFSPVADTVRSGVSTTEIPKVIILKTFFPFLFRKKSETNNREMLNGLNIKQVKDFVNLVKENPKEGLMTFYSHSKWENGTKSLNTITGYKLGGKMKQKRKFTFTLEDPMGLGGTNSKAPGPIEFLMHSIGACITAATNESATLEGIELSKIRVSLESDLNLHGMFELDPNVRPGFLNLRVTVEIAGNADRATLKKAAFSGYELSGVSDTVKNGVTTVVLPKISVVK